MDRNASLQEASTRTRPGRATLATFGDPLPMQAGTSKHARAGLGALMLATAFGAVRAQAAPDADRAPLLDLVTLRAASVVQRSLPFRSPYAGANSLPGTGETRGSQSAVLGLGKRLAPGLQAFVDLRWLTGSGVGGENGLANYANGDFSMGARVSGPYVLRAYLRGWRALGDADEPVDRDEDQIAGREPAERLEWKIGRILPTDDFDRLRYASNVLTEFLNLGLVNNPAWDNAQNARGTTDGLYAAWIRRRWELRAGSYRMPRTANGPVLDADFGRARSDQVELTVKAAESFDDGPVLRVLAFRNTARMGRYRVATAAAAGSGQPPSAAADEAPGRLKRGATLNLEWPLADAGETALFACAGVNDGRTEDFSFTEADRNACVGAQLSGRRFGRPDDRVGLALLASALSAPHRDYLGAGGLGFQLGDGRLRYGPERVVELYWRMQFSRAVALSPDLQWIANPGFNRDRGPARIVSLRLVLSF